ncbi:hypothetical protein RND81_04G177000 [Saponaria officinalis]|uniref:FAD-binding PCMH-type domain-containing protein n=1 Tax=Saponaria officinalis TaxID=3572 RepID=A0AAW1LNA9_SAPOF
MLKISIFIFVIILAIICQSNGHNTIENALIKCLSSHEVPSSLIFEQGNSSFPMVLQSYIRNLRFNTSTTRKPLFIVTATNVSHIQASILCAKEYGIQIKVRSGGHDYEGLSYVSIVPFFVVDMFNLRSVDVDVENETAWVQAGATLGEVYYEIGNKSKTLGFPVGVCPTVGVGGHFTGGGYGNMMRKYGLSSDNIIDAMIVDVNGRILDRKTMREDIFWVIRGGGGASFCVIVSYKIKLVHVLEKNLTDIVDQYLHIAPHLDHDAFIRLTLDVTNSTQTGLPTNRATFRCLFLGDTQTLLSLVSQNFPLLGLQKVDCLEMSRAVPDPARENSIFPNLITVTPFVSKNPREAFLNYRDIDLGINHQGLNSYVEGQKYGIKYFMGNFNRLVKIKTMVDPHNFFRNEQSIPTLPHHY